MLTFKQFTEGKEPKPLKVFRAEVHNGYEYAYTPHTVKAKSEREAREMWHAKGSPSETRKFRMIRVRDNS